MTRRSDKKYRVSIIMPLYNVAKTIHHTMESVLVNAHFLGNCEILIIDDGSVDDTVDIVSTYAAKYSFVKIFYQEHQGAGAARNKGLDVAKGEYVAFMDGDDYYPQLDTLKKLYDKAKEKNVSVCGGGLAWLKSNGETQIEFLFPYHGNEIIQEEMMKYRNWQYDYGYVRFIYKLEMIEANQIRFPNYLRFQDPFFLISVLLSVEHFLVIPDVVYVIRIHTTTKWTEQKIIDLLCALHEVMEIAKENELYELYRVLFERYKSHIPHIINAIVQYENKSKLLHALLKFIERLDVSILKKDTAYEKGDIVKDLINKLDPFVDVGMIILQIEEILQLKGKEQELSRVELSTNEEVLELTSSTKNAPINDYILLEAQIANLQNELIEANAKHRIQQILSFEGLSNRKFKKLLKMTHDYETFFELLPIAAKRFMVILAVKDTAGTHMPPRIIKCIRNASFLNFRKDLWRAYIGVIYEGRIFYDNYGENEEKCCYSYETLDQRFRLHVRSEPWRNGNCGDIVINGKNYSLNLRGVNIVIYDCKKNEVVDSIGFDSHEENRFIFRRDEIS